MLSPGNAALRGLLHVHPDVLRGRIRAPAERAACVAARGRDRDARLHQRARRVRRARGWPWRDHAASPRRRVPGADLPHPADGIFVDVLPAHPPPASPALQRTRARPGHAVGVHRDVPRIRAGQDRARAADQPAPGRPHLDADRPAGLHAEGRRPALRRSAIRAPRGSTSYSWFCTARCGSCRRSSRSARSTHSSTTSS